MNKKIACITTCWNRSLFTECMTGIVKAAGDFHFTVCVFNCFGGFDYHSTNTAGEFNIYNLPDLKDFDGIFVQGNQIQDYTVREQIGDQIERAGIPGVSLDLPVRGCINVGIDNYKAMRAMVDHIIKVHHRRNIHFISGPSYNWEVMQRLQAYDDAIREAGLTPHVHPGDYLFQTGYKAAKEILSQGEIPEAIVCVNDTTAFGVYRALKENGVGIPEQAIVTGFDHTDTVSGYCPSLTTIERHNADCAYNAISLLKELMEGGRGMNPAENEAQPLFLQSCGCIEKDDSVTFGFKDIYVEESEYRDHYNDVQQILMEKLLEAESIETLMEGIMANKGIFDCDNYYFVLNKEILDFDNSQSERGRRDISERVVLAATDDDTVLAHGGLMAEFSSRELIPKAVFESSPDSVFSFFPLHYKEESFGYVVFKGERLPLIDKGLLKHTLLYINLAIENGRKRYMLKELNEQLDALYVRDNLTGLYNRFGFERFANNILEKARSEKKKTAVIFADMDCLKAINDRFGHEIGDYAIKQVAQAIRKACVEKQLIVRYGGDEFLIIGVCGDLSDAEKLMEKIRRNLEEESSHSGLSFPINASLGCKILNPEENDTLEECIKKADERMYDEKKRKHAERH